MSEKVDIGCFDINSKTSLSVNVIVHVLILFIFLSLFFHFYISKLMTEKFQDEIQDLINNNLTSVIEKQNKDSNGSLASKIKNSQTQAGLTILSNMYSKKDPVTENNNEWVTKVNMLIVLIIIISLILVISVLYLSCGKCVPITHILIENIIIFIFVGIVEYLFFTKIAFNFIPVPPSTIVTSFYKDTQNSLIQ